MVEQPTTFDPQRVTELEARLETARAWARQMRAEMQQLKATLAEARSLCKLLTDETLNALDDLVMHISWNDEPLALEIAEQTRDDLDRYYTRSLISYDVER